MGEVLVADLCHRIFSQAEFLILEPRVLFEVIATIYATLGSALLGVNQCMFFLKIVLDLFVTDPISASTPQIN